MSISQEQQLKGTISNAELAGGNIEKRGPAGADGENGATFTPTVDSSGNLSWSNDKNLPNPSTVNIKGPKGDTGAPGKDGAAGTNGSNGADGENGATFTPTVDSSGNLSWSNDKNLPNPSTVNIKGPKGDTGAPGKDGTGVNILGNYDTVEELKNNHPIGNLGDSYLINNDLYIWFEEELDWINVGSIRGPAGTDGENGATFTPTVDADGNLIWSNDKNLPNPSTVNIKGPKGDTGAPGQDGAAGTNGNNGTDGENGATFTPTVDADGNLSWSNDKNLPNPSTVNIKGPKGDTGAPGKDGAAGTNGNNGADGENGATFTPTVDADGNLSWSNDKNLPNPSTVNIKGPKGDTANIYSYNMELTETIDAHAAFEIPANYIVGNGSLQVYYCGQKMIPVEDYIEEGSTGQISNMISFNTTIGNLDMSSVSGFEDFVETLEFIVRGDYSDNT